MNKKIEELKEQFIKQYISISCGDGWYQQFIKIPKDLDPDKVLENIGLDENYLYLDYNDMGDVFLERAWPEKKDIPENLLHLIEK